MVVTGTPTRPSGSRPWNGKIAIPICQMPWDLVGQAIPRLLKDES